MSWLPSRRRTATIVTLTLAWCALWGEVTPANIASGVVIAVVVSGSGIGTSGHGRVRLRPLFRFAGLVAVDLVTSTVSVAREVLTPTDRTDEGIIAVSVTAETSAHLLLLVVAVTLTPGTAVVDADPDSGVLYLHMLHVDRRDATTAHVQELASLACQALPTTGHEPDVSEV